MTYCTTAELVGITESKRSTATLQACIDEGDRKINLYLKSYGITGVAGDDLKSISLTMAKAELLDLGLQNGDLQTSDGDFSSSVNVTDAVKALRDSAYSALDQYISANTISGGKKIRCSRVRSRCH